ncbi:hypothetical protein M422DRAFT_242870 [Sphaerobolus stellatus SS14]|nr:hypothetical protein M422DRAFT_242870 [Sphaerobolus stellatus SS14]
MDDEKKGPIFKCYTFKKVTPLDETLAGSMTRDEEEKGAIYKCYTCTKFDLTSLWGYRLDRHTLGSNLPIGAKRTRSSCRRASPTARSAPPRFSHLPPTNSGGRTYLSTSQAFSRPPTHNQETLSAPHERYRHLFFRRYGNGNGWIDGSTSTRDDGSEPDTTVSVSGSVAAAGWSHYPSKPIPASTQFRPGPRSSG